MRPIVTVVEIPAPIRVVWDALAAIETHADWMTDAESIIFLSERRSGPGTVIRVRTRVGPLRIDDDMEFIEWEPPRRMAVRHIGRVSGTGEFLLTEGPDGTRLTWTEVLRFPWYFGGPLGLLVARPILRRVFKANLGRFARSLG
jgi:carbon monoxide dehydrogenase subunit G